MNQKSLEEVFSKTVPGDVGLIGDPVEHSLSPVMQNAAFQMWKKIFLDHGQPVPTYHMFHVSKDDLPQAIALVKKRRLRGVNITVPHKLAVVPLVDVLDETAKNFGAVNTICAGSVGLRGFNTDAEGFKLAVVHDLGFNASDQTALVLGAGGTGIVAVKQLLSLGVKKVFWWNRSAGKMTDMNGHGGKVERLSAESEAVRVSGEVDLIVNATSVGLGAKDGLPVPGLNFRKDQFVFDVIYHRETALLKEAKAKGAQVLGGLPMLLYQGAEAFKIWTGSPAPVEIMRAVLLEEVKKL